MAQIPQHGAMPAASEASRTNWAGNTTFHARELAKPGSIQDLQALLPRLQSAKALGSRHSFNRIADTTDTQIDLSALKGMHLDEASSTVTVGAGVTYGELSPWLHERGYALHNLASLPHISVAGACATGTHGSGLGNQCLSAAVTAMEFVTAAGERVRLSREHDGEHFTRAVVHLGALGAQTSLTLQAIPTFEIAQIVYENLSFDVLQDSLQQIFTAAYSVSLFTDWQGNRANQAWLKHKLDGPGRAELPRTFFGATRQTHKLHPLPNMPAAFCTEQLGIPGPWYDRLPHFRLDYTPSAGAELQTEYFVPLEHGYKALRAVEELRDQITPLLLVSELRAIAADDLALSMAYRRNSLALHFTWKQNTEAVLALLPQLEAQLAPFAARPHWAKLYTMDPGTVRDLYPRFREFEDAMRVLDPHGVFRNEYLRELTDPC